MRTTRTVTVLAMVALLCVACQTLYTSTVTITQVVDTAMKDWASMSVAGKTTAELDRRVIAAHDKYRAACGVAQAALIAYNKTGDQAEYVKALVAVRAAVDGIFDIVLPLLKQSDAWVLQDRLAKASKL